MEQYTIDQVLQFTINILSGIRVPVDQMKDIGIPVMNALDNLKAMQAAIGAAKTEKKAEEDDERETDAE